jgi:hypothetical protein
MVEVVASNRFHQAAFVQAAEAVAVQFEKSVYTK